MSGTVQIIKRESALPFEQDGVIQSPRLILVDPNIPTGKSDIWPTIKIAIKQAEQDVHEYGFIAVAVSYANLRLNACIHHEFAPSAIVLSSTPKTAKNIYVMGIGRKPPFASKRIDGHHSATRCSAVVRFLIEMLTKPGDLVADLEVNRHALPAIWCRRLGRSYTGRAAKAGTFDRAMAKLNQVELPATQLEMYAEKADG